MCGIAGLVRFAGLSPDERDAGRRMARLLAHRGPDQCGAYTDTCASLGHARLSIIDLEDGHQPMSNEDGSVSVVFNGEIYNHHELADTLRARGHTLRSRCDTEVIVHLYEDHGEDFVEHLNGMFAIAVWDARRERLVLVRDRLGVKPLYWHDNGQRVAFASELKAILAAGDVEASVDPLGLHDYLTFGHVPAPRSIIEGIRKLEPGHLAICTARGTRVRAYWEMPRPQSGAASTPEEFEALLADAIRLRRVADVPVGAFLSGGIDSAAIVAGMCRVGGSSGRVMTQTVGFDEADHDERAAAAQVASMLGTDHRELIVRADAAGALQRLVRHFDEPFADSSCIPTFYLAQATRERVKVALSGDGGDELLGGYRRYRFDVVEGRLRRAIPGMLRRPIASALGAAYPKADWLPRPLRAKRTLQNLACDDVTAHLRSVALCAGELPGQLLRPDIVPAEMGYSSFERARRLYARYPAADPLARVLYLDTRTLLADDMLTKVDRASMAVGLEVRTPLLDYRLVECAARLPSAQRTGKRVLRDVVARWCSPQVASRTKKGFNVPVDAWFRGPLRGLMEDHLLSRSAGLNRWIERSAVARLVREHQLGVRHHGHVLFALLSLELWAQAYLVRPATVRVERWLRPERRREVCTA